MKAQRVKVQLNGEERELAANTQLTDLLLELGIAKDRVAVEVNRALVPRAQHAETVLKEGDIVEVVTLVGGG